MNDSFLSLSDVQFQYAGETELTLHPLSFRIPSGSILGLVGPSGSGKTTLLKLLAGLWPPTAGEIYLEGEPISPYAEELIPGHPEVILVHQDYQLPAHQSLEDSLRWPLRYESPEDQTEEITRLMKLLGLEGLGHRRPRELSGGQQQRAAIALGLLEAPKLLLLDEPFSHVDAPRKAALRQEMLRRVREEDLTLVFTTHDAEDALVMASQVGLLQGGNLTQLDAPQTVYHHPIHEESASLLGPYNQVAALDGTPEQQWGFRPVSVQITPEGPHVGKVIAADFFGGYTLVTVEMANGDTLMISHSQPITSGTKIRFRVDLKSVVKRDQ